MSWELIGEDAEAIYHPGLLPLDWRTRAGAVIAWGREVGRGDACALWATKRPARVLHGVECWAAPGEWYGDTWVDWSTQGGAAPDGWWEVGEHTWCEQDDDECDDGECADRSDIVCLDLDAYDDAAVRQACADAPPEVHLVTAGEGWPWLSRVVGPCTVVVL